MPSSLLKAKLGITKMHENYSPIINHFTTQRGNPIFLAILCGKCHKHLFVYQKDGPGPLKRSYLDRIHQATIQLQEEHTLVQCPVCMRKLGHLSLYEKENRWAIYWFVDCITTQDLS